MNRCSSINLSNLYPIYAFSPRTFWTSIPFPVILITPCNSGQGLDTDVSTPSRIINEVLSEGPVPISAWARHAMQFLAIWCPKMRRKCVQGCVKCIFCEKNRMIQLYRHNDSDSNMAKKIWPGSKVNNIAQIASDVPWWDVMLMSLKDLVKKIQKRFLIESKLPPKEACCEICPCGICHFPMTYPHKDKFQLS